MGTLPYVGQGWEDGWRLVGDGTWVVCGVDWGGRRKGWCSGCECGSTMTKLEGRAVISGTQRGDHFALYPRDGSWSYMSGIIFGTLMCQGECLFW